LQEIREKQMRMLFYKLDSDDFDGFISYEKIEISQLTNDEIDVLTDFLMEIEEKQLTLDFETFK
jgi:hypothetical protein